MFNVIAIAAATLLTPVDAEPIDVIAGAYKPNAVFRITEVSADYSPRKGNHWARNFVSGEVFTQSECASLRAQLMEQRTNIWIRFNCEYVGEES